ncbi:PQQ-dependent sugar dehydrogenase [Vibrio sonorensis]|uniref:PQQ-dependent sugar dehydrogenase n=1 Tax=Vibrio sonorensis TaxID=1004316 RepID=UPI0008D909FD|nr:PQQ-dependent sugar dehydrogenase [Vibrio sonorensis]
MKALVILITMFTCPLYASDWTVKKVASGFSVPWGLASVDTHHLIVTEKSGAIYKLNTNSGSKTLLYKHQEVKMTGQGGLMDVARSPFQDNAYYFTYSKVTTSGIDTVLAVAQINNGALTNWQDLVVTDSQSGGGRHFGSRITFDSESVYFSVGDRGTRSNGQDLSTHSGSILRVDAQGNAFGNNPFINQQNAKAEIWSYGHRNPQGLVFDALTQQLWSIEHGPRGGDEINLIKRKANYGWPITSHGKEYWGPLDVGEAKEKPGIESPKWVYVPSIAPGSLIMYRGDKYPTLKGKLIAGSLKLTHLNVLTIDKDKVVKEQRLLESFGERIRALVTADDGYLYFSTDRGNVYRLTNSQP